MIHRSKSSHVRLVVVGLLAACMLALPSAAGAKAFDPVTTKIVMNKSIGGVKLGMSKSRAKSAWNGSAKCGAASAGIQYCRWQGKQKQGHADYTLKDGKVVTVAISCGIRSGQDFFAPPLTLQRTPKGTHLGSKSSDVLSDYPGGQQIMSTGSDPRLLFYRLNGGKTRLQFNTDGKLTSIVFANAITGV